MPFVRLRYKPELPEKFVGALAKLLPGLVAQALDTSRGGPEQRITATDVEVSVTKVGPLDVTGYDLEVIVWANDYPERRQSLNNRTEFLRNAVSIFVRRACQHDPEYALPDPDALRGFVWVLLAPGAFAEI